MIPDREIAAAKLNLALHVRDERPDGRHNIETVYVFCTDGDHLSAAPADTLELDVSGPFARDLPSASENLVLRAARALQAAAKVDTGAFLSLDKRLPVASGPWRRVRRRRGGAAPADVIVANRPGARCRRGASARQRRPRVSAQSSHPR